MKFQLQIQKFTLRVEHKGHWGAVSVSREYIENSVYKGVVWHLTYLHVDNFIRRQGIGTKLLDKACVKCWSIIGLPVFLCPDATEGEKLRKWYSKRGFRKRAGTDYMYRNPSKR